MQIPVVVLGDVDVHIRVGVEFVRDVAEAYLVGQDDGDERFVAVETLESILCSHDREDVSKRRHSLEVSVHPKNSPATNGVPPCQSRDWVEGEMARGRLDVEWHAILRRENIGLIRSMSIGMVEYGDMRISSSEFENGGMIPERFGRDFENVNPPLVIEDVPEAAVSLALIMEDPDVPASAGVPVWDHWVVFNIPIETRNLIKGWSPAGVRGRGTRGELEYGGPRPPDREHRYFFKLYALDTMLELPEGSTKTEVLDAMNGHVLETAELMGRFAPVIHKL